MELEATSGLGADWVRGSPPPGAVRVRLRGAGLLQVGSSTRRSSRNSKRPRVDYCVLEGDAPGVPSASTGEGFSAGYPLWFEYQTDSDDSDGTASRKKDLKAR